MPHWAGEGTQVLAITGHAGRTAVEGRRFGGILRPVCPVVVRLGTRVATLVLEYLLVCPSEVPMPSQKVALGMLDDEGFVWCTAYRSVNGQCLINVCDNKIIVAVLRSSSDASGRLWCLLCQAIHSFDVVGLFWG
jgi:hypothetical protein